MSPCSGLPVDGSRDAALSTTVPPARRIGRHLWRGHSVVARAVHVSYQQKTHVSGFVAPTVGLISRGSGGVFGGGGLVGSSSESVATVVLRDEAGAERTHELPADVSPREGAVLRLDRLDGTTFAATNLSARQPVRWLLGPGAFIPVRRWRKRDTLCVLLTLVALWAGSVGWALVFALRPAWVAWRILEGRRRQRELGVYMNEIAA